MPKRLFAVYLGGRAPRCNTELHDVVFAVGETLDSTYETLMDKWFGDPQRMHVDSWIDLQVVDGHRISLEKGGPRGTRRLFFVNLGAYLPGQFTELHANAFVVAEDEKAVKSRAKAELLRGTQSVHMDDLYDIDDCLEISEVDGYRIRLEPTQDIQEFAPNNGFHVLPAAVVSAYAARRVNAGL
ncbi:MAG TPA: DUF1543 domain-containing protein [Opitutaceae bacterium]|jgi:hypothetical protein